METVRQNLLDAGCREDEITFILSCLDQGRTKDAVKAMRKCRCERMEILHEEARKVDCLDYLIRKSETERRNSK